MSPKPQWSTWQPNERACSLHRWEKCSLALPERALQASQGVFWSHRQTASSYFVCRQDIAPKYKCARAAGYTTPHCAGHACLPCFATILAAHTWAHSCYSYQDLAQGPTRSHARGALLRTYQDYHSSKTRGWHRRACGIRKLATHLAEKLSDIPTESGPTPTASSVAGRPRMT